MAFGLAPALVLFALTWARGSLIPPGTAVVLLNGVPGDVESESEYRQQIESWIEIARNGGRAQKLIVLCDNPEAVSKGVGDSPQTAHGQAGRLPYFGRASRENFVAIARQLAGWTNPLVVIAWGHGGRQGDKPVFHVRGPRITPGDFKTLAEAIPSAASGWILFFRGSGAFARDIAGPGRQVFSSDRETVFSSDPVGMPLLLKLARDEPDLPFDGMMQEFGRATAAWYEERHLARTEEPTLWLSREEPMLLAELGTQDRGQEENTKHQTSPFAKATADRRDTNETSNPTLQTAEGREQRTEQSKHQTPNPKHQSENTGPGTENSSQWSGVRGQGSGQPAPGPGWEGIRRVEAQDYPESDGVILRRRISYTLGSSPAIAGEQDEYAQVLTPEGKHLGDFDIAYSPPMEDVAFLDCEVLGADGKLARLDPDAIREGHEPGIEDYHTSQNKFFSLPGVVPGSVLHVHYRTQWKEFPLPHLFLEIPIDESTPTRDLVIEVRVPRETAFHWAFDGVHGPRPTVEPTSYGLSYTWRFEHLAPRQREILASPQPDGRLLVSTFPDWAAFSDWYQRISKLADTVTPEIAAKAAELTRNAPNERAKVVALYNFVTGLRYVAVPLGINSLRPHAAARVLENQFGDCKDKANLFNALLRAAGVPADLVLVPRFGQAREDLPGLAFNHAISHVALDGRTLWLDTTDDICRFGLLPPGDPGRRVLVLEKMSDRSDKSDKSDKSNEQREALTQLPTPKPDEHQLTLRGQVQCSSPGEAWPLQLKASATGFCDYQLRAMAREGKEHAGSMPLLASVYRPVVASFSLEKQNATLVSELDKDFRWEAKGTCVGLSWARDSGWALRAPFWLPKQWEQALHRRKTPLYLNDGYPLSLDEEFEFALPTRAQPAALPGVCENKAEPLKWKILWKKSGDNRLSATFRAELARGELSEAETSLFQQQLRDLMAALAPEASFIGRYEMAR